MSRNPSPTHLRLVRPPDPARSLVHEAGFHKRCLDVFEDAARADEALRDITYNLARANRLGSYRVLVKGNQGLVRAVTFKTDKTPSGLAVLVFREDQQSGTLHLLDVHAVATRSLFWKKRRLPVSELQLVLRASLLLLELQGLAQLAESVAPHLADPIARSANALELVRGAAAR